MYFLFFCIKPSKNFLFQFICIYLFQQTNRIMSKGVTISQVGVEEDRYAVYPDGTILDQAKTKWLKKSTHSTGLKVVSLRRSDRRGYMTCMVSRVVADHFVSYPEDWTPDFRAYHVSPDIQNNHFSNIVWEKFSRDRSIRSPEVRSAVENIFKYHQAGDDVLKIKEKVGFTTVQLVNLILEGKVYGTISQNLQLAIL